jgi:energy-coupling factor transporter ATP-binding protein EcfA2
MLLHISDQGGAPQARTFFMPTETDALAEWVSQHNAERRNIYWQPNDTAQRNSKPGKADMTAARLAWADCDPDIDRFGSYDAARAHLTGEHAATLRPVASFVIDSGNGLQAFFRLPEPVALPDALDSYERANKAVGEAFDGPGTFNCDRIMRVPGTLNWPTATKRKKGYPAAPSMSRIISVTDRTYTVDDLVKLATEHDKLTDDIAPEHDALAGVDAETGEVDPLRRFDDLLRTDAKLRARWEGGTTGLKDATGSGMDMSMYSMLVKRRFAHDEIAAIMDDWPRGGTGREQGDRYWERMRDRSAAATALQAEATNSRPQSGDGVIVTNGASVEMAPIRWLWPDWLAQGKLHLLAGAPGQGKTTIALALAAIVTSGGRWPDGSQCEAGSVLIWSGEDDIADTLMPRLIAAGAEKSRVHFITGARIDGEKHTFDPARDMNSLHDATDRIGNVRLLVVDPIVSAVAGDSHKNAEVRRALQPLVDLAEYIGAALLGITHFSKGGQGDPTQRVIGSVAFTAVARVVMVAAKVGSEGGQDRRIIARAKSNIGADGGGFPYTLEQCELAPGINASRVVWGDLVAGTARELLTDSDAPDGDERPSAKDAAADFLVLTLGDRVELAKTVETKARAAGIAWRTVRRAAKSLGVIKIRGPEGKSFWGLPKVDDSTWLGPETEVTSPG